VTLLAAGFLAVAAAAGAEAATPYVAIGDSYTVTGAMTTLYKAETHCAQSADSYPYRVAAALDLSLTDVACAGARTENVTVAQYEDQPPQGDALNASTAVVTISLGGNDHNLFATLVEGCTQVDYYEGLPGKAPCKAKYEGFVQQAFAEEQPAQEAALRRVKELAPRSKVFVVGYPEITPKKGACFNSIPWREKDLAWFRSKFEKVADKIMKRSAKALHAVYVDTFKPSEGHNACQSPEARWVEPLADPLNGVPVHPNAAGEEHDAFAVERAMVKAGVG
jgi:hypothetical protein